jgi:hypothetical protein
LETQQKNDKDQPYIEWSIDKFQSDLHQYRSILNDEGIWLFLATLGCWGVEKGWFQLAACIATLIIFSKRIKRFPVAQNSFAKTIELLDNRIELEVELPSNKQRLQAKLRVVKEALVEYGSAMRMNVVFWICWTFFGASLLYAGCGLLYSKP